MPAAQYLAVTNGWIETPYFIDRSLRYSAIRARILRMETRGLYQTTPESLHTLYWNFN